MERIIERMHVAGRKEERRNKGREGQGRRKKEAGKRESEGIRVKYYREGEGEGRKGRS